MAASDEILALVAAAEQRSEHPIAEAIVQAARDKELSIPEIQQFSVEPGYGIDALIDGRRIIVGADRYMTKIGVDITSAKDIATDLASAAKTPLYATIDGALAAIIAAFRLEPHTLLIVVQGVENGSPAPRAT